MRVEIDGELLEKLSVLMKEQNLKSIKKTIAFLYGEYENRNKIEFDGVYSQEKFVDRLLEKFDKKYNNVYETLKYSSKSIEKNSVLLLDAINTILVQQNYNICHPADVIQSPVLETSEKRYSDKISVRKQKKDNSVKRESQL